MSLPRPSGLKAPSKIGKPTGLPLPKSTSTPAADKAKSPELEIPPPPSDDFKIGDRIWVGGSKPGVIAFLGETQFATGEWAGVVLDKPEGKNDGSVKGVRYFQCEPDRGVFARISKLSRTPGLLPSADRQDDASSEAASHQANGMSVRPTTPSMTPARSSFGSNTSLSRTSPAPIVKTGTRPPLKVGDRVLVSGSKMGTLQYIGETDFAKGEWVGVELDEKQGKNDGAVAGKRYFECKPMYGLFAPVHKVTRLTSGAGPGKATTPSPQTRSSMNTSLRLSKERSGSQESVSSISSSASSVSRSRVRLGVTSLGNQLPLRQQRKQELSSTPLSAKPGHRPSTLNITATTSALQKALKEKEEHIEQLLKERDLERSEVARAAAQVDEAEGQMSMMRMEQERYKQDVDDTITKLRALVEDLKLERTELTNQLDIEKRKVEDLQFQIEEESMMKDDLETRTEEEEMRFRELERLQHREKERADKLEQELYALKAMAKDSAEKLASTDELNINYLDQIEEITHKLSQAETKIKSYESNRLEEGAKTSQVSIELEEKEAKVMELEELLTTKNKEVKQLSNQLQEVEEDLLASREKNNQLQNQVEKLSSQLDNQSKASETFNTELQQLKSQISDLQRKLDSSNDNCKRLSDDKIQLEQQMNDMMRNSGDSSKRMSILTEQLQDRNRKIQDLQADLSSSTQQVAKSKEENLKLRKDAEKERENITVKHNENINTIKSTLQDVQKELSKANNKMVSMKEDFEKEKEDVVNRKNSEINSLKKNLDQVKADLEKQEVQTQAHKQVLDKLNMDTEALKFEKEKADKLVKRLESEKDTINTDLIHIRVLNSKVQLDYEKLVDEKNKLLQQLEDLKEDKERVSDSKSSIQHEKEELLSEKAQLMEEKDKVSRELMESKALLQEKDIHVEELQKEVEKLKTEVSHKEQMMSQQSQNQSQNLQTQIEKGQARIKELDGMLQSEISKGEKKVKDLEKKLLMQTSEADQKYNQLEALFKEVEDERDTMKAQLEFSNLVAEERRRLEEQNMQLNQEMEKSEERKEIESLEKAKTSLQKEVSNLKNENSSLEKYRKMAEKLEQEKKDFVSQINSLKSQIQAGEVNSNTIELSANEVEDKQTTDGQVEFLNSVIVDLQKKNQDLQTRLEAMESGVITNGEADSSIEVVGDSKKPPPRLFCDICDVFDKHDTEDCPCQAMDYDDNTPSPSHHHGDRKQSRPYCDICEEFHEPCENLQLTIPQDQVVTSGPRVRYRSGSEKVEIEDLSLCDIFDSVQVGIKTPLGLHEGLFKIEKTKEIDDNYPNDDTNTALANQKHVEPGIDTKCVSLDMSVDVSGGLEEIYVHKVSRQDCIGEYNQPNVGTPRSVQLYDTSVGLNTTDNENDLCKILEECNNKCKAEVEERRQDATGLDEDLDENDVMVEESSHDSVSDLPSKLITGKKVIFTEIENDSYSYGNEYAVGGTVEANEKLCGKHDVLFNDHLMPEHEHIYSENHNTDEMEGAVGENSNDMRGNISAEYTGAIEKNNVKDTYDTTDAKRSDTVYEFDYLERESVNESSENRKQEPTLETFDDNEHCNSPNINMNVVDNYLINENCEPQQEEYIHQKDDNPQNSRDSASISEAEHLKDQFGSITRQKRATDNPDRDENRDSCQLS